MEQMVGNVLDQRHHLRLPACVGPTITCNAWNTRPTRAAELIVLIVLVAMLIGSVHVAGTCFC
jgi:hypothetical protein